MSLEKIKISALTQANTLTGPEKVPMVQDINGIPTTVEASAQEIANLGAGGDRTIAKLENINLKDVADNVLDWIGENLSNNTGPASVVVKHVSGTYINKIIPAVSGTGTFDVTSEANNPGGGSSAVQIRVDSTVVSFISLDPGATKTIAECIVDIINNAQGDWGITNPSGDTIQLSEPPGQEGAFDGQQININNQLGVTFTIANATTIEGGSPERTTAFTLQQNGTNVPLNIKDAVQGLEAGKVVSVAFQNSLFSTLGDWAIPVTEGTEEDFVISIYLKGDRV